MVIGGNGRHFRTIFRFLFVFRPGLSCVFLGVFFQVNHEEIRSGDHWEIISEKMLFWINRTCTSRRFYEFKKKPLYETFSAIFKPPSYC